VLDPALLRPGRFDRRIVVPVPDIGGRKGILEVHTRKTPMSGDVDLDVISPQHERFCGATCENLVNEQRCWRHGPTRTHLDMEDFEAAADKVMMGVERKSAIISEKRPKRDVAFHDRHALVAKLLPQGED